MLNIDFKRDFLKKISKIKNNADKVKVKKQVEKMLKNPKIGKLMKYGRKGTREVYVAPYRLAYSCISLEDKIIFLEIYHQDEQ